ncbi:hypothetical protein LTR37_012213 [Vermiconidia calcicola]|uniref:Uncharacterized protein n=1 Tax=Vermiconidia calcicola TaxID=1690605 RepID=A0ACC3N2X9_9PEZI|nr:hypothetical protein LTR37_012213 [Vermiconidia calcicola]
MVWAKKVSAILVFGAGILVNIPVAYGLSYLYQHSNDIASDPTLKSPPFIYAAQTAMAVSMWCRALEVAKWLGRQMGYATYGHATTPNGSYAMSNGNDPSAGTRYIAYVTGTKQSATRSTRSNQSRLLYNLMSANDKSVAEDEIELRPAGAAMHTSDATTSRTRNNQGSMQRIEVSTEYGYTVQSRQ